MKRANLAVALAVAGASACWTFGGSPVATGFSTAATGRVTVSVGTFPPPQVTLHGADDCKKGGWATSTNPVFKNQGDCVSHFTPAGGNGSQQGAKVAPPEAGSTASAPAPQGAGAPAATAPEEPADAPTPAAPAAPITQAAPAAAAAVPDAG